MPISWDLDYSYQHDDGSLQPLPMPGRTALVVCDGWQQVRPARDTEPDGYRPYPVEGAGFVVVDGVCDFPWQVRLEYRRRWGRDCPI